jgi:hypothetical protein
MLQFGLQKHHCPIGLSFRPKSTARPCHNSPVIPVTSLPPSPPKATKLLQSAGPCGGREALGIFSHAPGSRTVLRDKSRAPRLGRVFQGASILALPRGHFQDAPHSISPGK